MDYLECLPILDILYMAGGSTLKLEIGHCALYQDMVFQNGKRATCFPFGEALAFSRLSTFSSSVCFPLLYHIAINYPPSASADGPPFLSRKELHFAIFPQLSLAFLRFRKAEEMQHITFILSDSHSGFYFPPGRLRWQSADDPMVQTVSPETCGLPFRLKGLRTFACFPVSQQSGINYEKLYKIWTYSPSS